MKALILLGGLGTRLRPFTLEKPKPILPILNRPFIAYQLELLKKHGVREVVLALGYRAAHFKKHLGSGKQWGMRFIYSIEKEALGTGGAIGLARQYLTEPSYIFNGDNFGFFNLGRLRRAFEQKKADAVLMLQPVNNPSAYGLIETDFQGRITRFLEKPSQEEATTNTINAGCYLFSPRVIGQIPEGRPVSVERETFPALLDGGYRLYGILHEGYWSDIGTLVSYWTTHRDLMALWAKTPPRDRVKIRPGLWADGPCRVGKNVTIQGTALLGRGCRVGDGVTFQGFVCVGAGTVIEEGAMLSNSVLHAQARVGVNAAVHSSLVGEKCRVGDHSRVGPGTALANRSATGAFSQQGLVFGESEEK